MFYDNLKAECDKQGLKLTTVVLECGGTKGVIGGWKKGAAPRSDIVMKLAVRLNVPTDYLLFGNEHIFNLSSSEKELISYFTVLSEEDKGRVIGKAETLAELAAERTAEQEKELKNRKSHIAKCLPLNTCQLRYYDNSVSAGTGLFLDEAIAETLTVRNTPEAQQADYAIPVSGDSMEDEYHDGDIVLVKSCPCVRKGEVGIFLLDGNVYIKEYGEKCLISYNENYDPIDLSKFETAACLGKVLGIAEVISKTHFNSIKNCTKNGAD